jgi:NADH dehydrogenase FAD-containing subunit
MSGQRRVLVIGGGFAGLCVARDMATHFLVTIVDCKEFFEYTPGILRCYVKPKHFDALSFSLHPVIEQKMGCKFIWGEVKKLGADRTAVIKPMFTDKEETIDFDYCIISAGCNFGPREDTKGESLWFPTVHEIGRSVSEWKQFDERFIEGRRRHMFHEWAYLKGLQEKKGSVLIAGAGFIGVEWITELDHFFKGLNLGLMDMLPRALGPLPDSAAKYCQRYMEKCKITQVYSLKKVGDKMAKVQFNEQTKKLDETPVNWAEAFGNMPQPDKEYSCIGVKASNYFIDDKCLSKDGPGGGGWILMDKTLAVTKVCKAEKVIVTDAPSHTDAHKKELIGEYSKSGDSYSFGKAKISFDAKESKWKLEHDGKNYFHTTKVKPGAPSDSTLHYGTMTFTDGKAKIMVKATEPWSVDGGYPRVYAIGDCNYACYMGDGPPPAWPIPPIAKISYPGEEEAVIAARNIEKTDHLLHGQGDEDCFGTKIKIHEMHWPWGAGMFATSLGPGDACFVVAANWTKGSGWMVLWGSLSAVQKEIIEHSKVDECGHGFLGRAIWHFVHHTPIHLWGGGPRWGY